MRRIWDCMMYRDEADMLAMHLEETPQVHKYVLVESNITHRGDPKPWNYMGDYPDRVITVRTEIDPELTPWQIEHTQRDAALGALEAAGADLDDVVIISDVDKIPSQTALAWTGWPVVSLRMRTTLYAVDWVVPDDKLPSQAVMCTLRFLKSMAGSSLSWALDNRHRFPQLGDGGWHFSWLGGPEKQAEKLDTGTCHTEILDTPEAALIRSGARYRDGADGGGLPVVAAVVDSTWPAMIRERRCPPEWFRPAEVAA